MNILAIGNSFSQDATRYLYSIAHADKHPLAVANLYIGGCPLVRHFRNMHSEERAYDLQYNGISTNFYVSLKEALLNRAWEVVTLQQGSRYSFNYASYSPYLEEVAAYVRKLSPKSKIYIHQTWAYEDGSQLLKNMGYDSYKSMQSDIVAAYSKAAESINAAGIIRSGELLGKLLEAGIPSVHRDSLHTSLGIGRYAIGLLWYRTLCGRSVAENTFSEFDEPISNEHIALIKETVESF